MKQLDIEPAEEMPSSTLTSTEGIGQCYSSSMLPQRLQITSDSSIEEGEIITETDMPPLTGKFSLNLLTCPHPKPVCHESETKTSHFITFDFSKLPFQHCSRLFFASTKHPELSF